MNHTWPYTAGLIALVMLIAAVSPGGCQLGAKGTGRNTQGEEPSLGSGPDEADDAGGTPLADPLFPLELRLLGPRLVPTLAALLQEGVLEDTRQLRTAVRTLLNYRTATVDVKEPPKARGVQCGSGTGPYYRVKSTKGFSEMRGLVDLPESFSIATDTSNPHWYMGAATEGGVAEGGVVYRMDLGSWMGFANDEANGYQLYELSGHLSAGDTVHLQFRVGEDGYTVTVARQDGTVLMNERRQVPPSWSYRANEPTLTVRYVHSIAQICERLHNGSYTSGTRFRNVRVVGTTAGKSMPVRLESAHVSGAHARTPEAITTAAAAPYYSIRVDIDLRPVP